MSFAAFDQNYELKEVIGHGSCCTVRKVIHKETRQVFAAKMYQNEILKAKNQIDLLIRLDHPSIVNIYEFYEEEGLIILILEYMSGGELYDQVGQRKSFNQAQVRQYMKILTDAVRYCHEMGVVHRDIKPENLLLSTSGPDGILKLADFGISKILSDEKLNTNCGTPIYMAPQIWNQMSYNEKVDIWSLGVVMYYLLSGEHPFTGQNQQSLGKEITSNQVKFQDPIWESISSRAIILLRQLLTKDPQKRLSAIEIQNHIWLNSVDQIPAQIEEKEVNLALTVNKIGRYIFKQKMHKKKRSLIDLLSARKLPKNRLTFLISKSRSSMEEQTTQEENFMALT